MDPEGDNFLGTGLNAQDALVAIRLQQVENSFPVLTAKEQQVRLKLVIELSVELEKIRQISIQSTAWGEMAIGDVINGNWADLPDKIDFLKFSMESEDFQKEYAPLWEKFRGLLELASLNSVESN